MWDKTVGLNIFWDKIKCGVLNFEQYNDNNINNPTISDAYGRDAYFGTCFKLYTKDEIIIKLNMSNVNDFLIKQSQIIDRIYDTDFIEKTLMSWLYDDEESVKYVLPQKVHINCNDINDVEFFR